MPNKPVDKDTLPLNQPRRTPSHPTKSHVVKTKVDGKEKIIRFGEQGASTAGKPKAGESDKMKAKRASFKSRHAKNIAKGPSSAAYWANKVKWAEGGTVESTSGLQDLLDKYAEGAVKSTRTVTDALANLTPMGDMSREAARAATLVYPKETELGGEADALRHMLFQSELSDKYGELPAYMVGLANEYLRGGLQSPAERRMDLDNDMLGRAFGRTVSDPDERMRMMMDLIDMGGATTLEDSELGYARGGPVPGFGRGGNWAEIAAKARLGVKTAAEELLDLSQEAKSARAVEQGFTDRLWHSSNEVFAGSPQAKEAIEYNIPIRREFKNVFGGTYFSPESDLTGEIFGKGTFGGPAEYLIKKGNNFDAHHPSMGEEQKKQLKDILNSVLDTDDIEGAAARLDIPLEDVDSFDLFTDGEFYQAFGRDAQDKVMNAFSKRGYDSVTFPDNLASGDMTRSTVVFNPSHIRSPDADFDPSKLDSSDLGHAKGGSVPGFGRGGINPKELAAKVSGTLKEAQDLLGITPEAQAAWRASRTGSKRTRVPEVKSAANSLRLGDISTDEYQAIVRQFMPIKPLGAVQNVPTFENIALSLSKDPNKSAGIVGVNVDIPDGTRIASRLDIPAYQNYDTWVVSLHDGTKKGGNAVGYGQTAVLNNVNFESSAKGALNIASEALKPSGEKYDKSTIARMYGDWANHSAEDVQRAATSILEDGDPDWVEIGMNPDRHSYFYRKSDGAPVGSAEQVIQIGPLVLAKKVKTIAIDDPAHLVETPNGPRHYARGGINPKALAKELKGGEVMGYAEGGLAELADKYSKDYYQFPFDDHDEHYLKFAGGGDLAKILREWLKDHPEKGLADLKTRQPAIEHYQGILADPTLANRRIGTGTHEAGSPLYYDMAQQELNALKPDIALNNFVDGALNKYIKRDYGTDWDPLTTLTPDERHVPEGVNNVARQGEPTLRSRNWPPIRFGSEAGTKKIIDGLRSTTRDLIHSPTAGYRTTGLRIDDVYKANPWLTGKPRDMELFYDFNPHYGAFPHLINTLRRTITPDSGLPNELRLNPESLQRMSVLQASKLVGKVNQWDKAQAQAASQRLMLNPFKEYDSGYKWVKLPNAREPEGLKSVMDLGCKGGWCTQQEDQAKGYSNYARGDHLYALLDPEGRPHAQVSTFEGDPHDWERNKNITSMQPLANDFDSQYVSDWMKKDPNYKNQIKGYMQDFAGSNDWTHNGAVDGMDAIDMIPTNDWEKYFKLNHMKYEPLRGSLNYDPANVGGSDAVYLEAVRRARQNASQREEKIPAYMTVRQSKNMIQQFMPRLDERERINAQVERLFQKPPVEGYAEGGRAMKDLKDEPAPDIYDSQKRSKTGIDVLDNMLDPFYAMRAGIDAQVLPEEVQWTDDEGNMHSYTAPGIANSALGLASYAQLFGGPEYPMADAGSDAYDTGLQRALDHYALPVRNDMGFVNKTGLTLGEMLGQIPLVPLSAANKVRQGAQVLGGAMPFIKKTLMAIPEYLGPTIEPTALNYAIGTAGGMAFPPAMEGLMRMYEKYSPELEYEVPDTDMRGLLDDIGNPIDRESDKRVAQWVAEQRGPSDERARIADNVRRSMMTPGFGKGGFNPKELAEKLAKEAAEDVPKNLYTAADRANAGRKAAQLISSQEPVKASEALGQLMERGFKNTTTTVADRTRVGGGNIGGANFPAISEVDPGYEDIVWGVMDKGTGSRLTNLTTPETAWTTMLGSGTQLKTNPIVFDKLMRGFLGSMKQGNLSDDLASKINHNLALVFGEGADIRDPMIWQLADTFDKRSVLANLMMGKGMPKSKGGIPLGGELRGGAIFNPSEILIRETEPTLMHPLYGGNVPTYAAGPRTFSLDGTAEYRPDLHPGFPTLLHGEDLGFNMIPTPTEVYLPDWHRAFKAANPDRKGPGYYDLALGVEGEGLPSQALTEKYIRHLIREGYSHGGNVEMQDLQDMLDKYNQDTRVNYG